MVLIKKSFCFRFNSHLINKYLRNCSNLTFDDIKALIPKKIERGPTDVLKALAETCQRDVTAFDYKFMDDPFFYCSTHSGKILNSLNLESGRKSARWIVKHYPQLFDHKVSDPFIKALAPQIEYNENSNVSEETLIRVVHERNVSDAINIYNLLKKKNLDVSINTKQMLLELVCFYNCEKLHHENDFEINWQADTKRQNLPKTWKDEGFAEELFKDINLDCSLAYSTLIQGMLKYGQLEKALVFLKEGQEKNLKFTVWVYNGLIENANTIYQNNIRRWNYIIELLNEMKINQVAPNLYTLNSIMKSLNAMIRYDRKSAKFITKNAFQVLSEFEQIGIIPSLGTHYYTLQLLCSHPNLYPKKQNFFKATLNFIDKKKWDIQHPDDKHFFLFAMQICDKTRDVESAHILVNLLHKNNRKFIGGQIKERIFYEKYFYILLENEPIECVMEIYQKFVPTIFNLSDNLYSKTIGVIKENEALDFLPIIWNDISDFYASKKNTFAKQILSLSEVWNGTDEKVSAVFEQATKLCTPYLKSENMFNISEYMISNLMITFLKLKKFDDAVDLFKEVEEKSLKDFNFNLNFKAIEHFYEFLIANDNLLSNDNQIKNYILRCLKFAKTMNHPNIKKLAEKALPYLNEGDSNFEWVKKLTEEIQPNAKENKKEKPKHETENST